MQDEAHFGFFPHIFSMLCRTDFEECKAEKRINVRWRMQASCRDGSSDGDTCVHAENEWHNTLEIDALA